MGGYSSQGFYRISTITCMDMPAAELTFDDVQDLFHRPVPAAKAARLLHLGVEVPDDHCYVLRQLPKHRIPLRERFLLKTLKNRQYALFQPPKAVPLLHLDV